MPGLHPIRKIARYVPERQWPSRLLFVSLGLLMMLVGWEAIRQGYRWVRNYDATQGFIGYGTTLMFVFFGAIFVLLSLVPWPKPDIKPRSKDDMYKMP
jgi:O-antigen/teichoic acid export membrane protein